MTVKRDVVIVGGGIAGLAATWELRHRDVLLLEAGDRLGGRMRSDPCGEYWLNFGAHLFPAPGSYVDGLVQSCGLETVPVWGSMMGLALGEKLLTTGRPETYPLRLPLGWRDRVAFARAGITIQRAVRRYRRATDRYAFEDQRTFAELLGPLPPAASEIFACAAHRATAELDELSAGCGVGLFALVWDGSASLIARNLVGGTGSLPAALGARLGERVRTNAAVEAIEADGDRLLVRCAGEAIQARHVIVAAQAPHAAPLVTPLAPQAGESLARMSYGAFLSVAIETDEAQAMPYDDVYAMATPGRAFDMFTNQAHALRAEGPRRPGGSLMLFAGGHGAARLSSEADDVIVDRFLADLYELFPQTRAVISRTAVHRWELGNVYAKPGRGRLQGALEGALGAAENLHLAGDYFAELGNMEAAARTGLAAAVRVDAKLREGAHG